MPPEGTDPNAQTGGPGNNDGGRTGQGTPPANGGKTFTQDDLDRVVRERLAEQARKHEDKATKDREAAEAEREKTRLAEAGQYKEIADKADERAKKAEQALESERATLRDRVIRTEIRSVATELRFADPADAYRFLDLSQVEVNEQGDPVNVKALLEALIDPKKGNKGYLVAQQVGRQGIPRTPDGGGNAPDPTEVAQQHRDAQLRTGRYARF